MPITRDAAAALSAALYRQVLNRDPDPDGGGLLAATLETGTLDEAGARATLASSPEAVGLVAGLYASVLGHPPDAAGLQQFQATLAAGLIRAANVRGSLALSTEATVLVRAAYQQALGRVADPAGVNAAQAALAAGASLGTIRSGLANSAEAAASLTRAYQDQFGLSPSTVTLSIQVRELARGRSFGDTVTVTNRQSRTSGLVFNNYGYAIPAAYSDTGAAGFVTIAGSIGLLTGFAPVTAVAPTPPAAGVPAIPAGPDRIVLDLQRSIGSPPLTFTATLDGLALGGATVTAANTGTPGILPVDEVTFTGAVGPGTHRLTLQLTDPAAGTLIVQSATFDGVSVLRLGSASTGGGTLDLFLRTQLPPVVIVPA